MGEATAPSAPVGMVGVGNLGAAMAHRLIERGYDLRLCTRRPETLAPLVARGAKVVSSPAALGASVDTVLVVLRDLEQLETVLFDQGLLAAMSPGKTIVINSTIAPVDCKALASRANAAGVDVLDAPVTGGPAGALAGTLTIMVGGDEGVLARCRGVLDDLGNVVHIGPMGAGSLVKLINNAAYSAQLRIAMAAVDVARQWSIDPEVVASVVGSGSGASWALSRIAGSGFSLDLKGTPGAAHILGLLTKDAKQLEASTDPHGPDGVLAALALDALHALAERPAAPPAP